MIRIGVVGCGRILAAHLRGYRLLRAAGVDDFCITALCSRRADDARMVVRRGEGPMQRPPASDLPGDPLAIGDEYLSDFQPGVEVAVYSDYREMIANAPIDAVNDFTPHALHHQVAACAFDRGKHLLTQKPLAVSVAAARRMCERAEALGLTFGVFENFRFMPETRHLRWAFENENSPLGLPQILLLCYVGAWWAPNFVVAHTPWRHAAREAGGISLDLGVHFFDQIRHFAGEIDTVSARTAIVEPKRSMSPGQDGIAIDCDADDTCMVSFTTARGATGNLVASWAGRGGPTTVGDGTVYYGTGGRVTGGRATLANGATRLLADLYRAGAESTRQVADFPLDLEDSFALGQHDWLEAIRQRREPETSGREGLRDLAAAYAILESANTGRTVRVADVLAGTVREFQASVDRSFGLW
jgi:predicted dehydrogenase